MIKILLYLSILFASGITAGEGVAVYGDNQSAQPDSFYEQDDSNTIDGNTIDGDDQAAPAHLDCFVIVERTQPLLNKLERYSRHSSPKPYAIRAPPTPQQVLLKRV